MNRWRCSTSWIEGGEALLLPPGLSALYGPLRFPPHPDRPYVVVTARGEFDPGRRLFRSDEVPVLIVTMASGSRRIQELGMTPSIQVAVADGFDRLSARSIVDAVGRTHSSEVILVEGGQHLLGDFFAEGLLDERFLTLSP